MPLNKSTPVSTWIHDFVHSQNPKFNGKSKKDRIRMALAAAYSKQNEHLEEARKFHVYFGSEHLGTFEAKSGREAREKASAAQLLKPKKPLSPSYTSSSLTTKQVKEEMTPHLWSKFKEHSINRIKHAHQSGSLSVRDAHLQLRHQGLSHEDALKKIREDFIIDESDLASILEAAKRGIPLEGHPYHKKTDAELHYIMKDAGEASRLHDQMHKGATGKYNKYADQVNDAATVMHYRKTHNVKEDVIYEAGKASKETMKRKYLGKTRGTTDTGKPAHQVVIDPFVKVDRTNRRG